MSEVQEEIVEKAARALCTASGEWATRGADFLWNAAADPLADDRYRDYVERYKVSARAALLASGLPAAIEARDKALERVKELETALKGILYHAENQDMNHLTFRVKARECAMSALGEE